MPLTLEKQIVLKKWAMPWLASDGCTMARPSATLHVSYRMLSYGRTRIISTRIVPHVIVQTKPYYFQHNIWHLFLFWDLFLIPLYSYPLRRPRDVTEITVGRYYVCKAFYYFNKSICKAFCVFNNSIRWCKGVSCMFFQVHALDIGSSWLTHT